MKIYKHYTEPSESIFAMSKIVKKYAISDIVQEIGEFVYFSECNSSHGPRIKFYGGTKETSTTEKAPTLEFDSDGNCTVRLADWMDKKNCPNGYDKKYISNLDKFVKTNISILLLVWFYHLDEADALAYFHGQITFEDLLDSVKYDLPSTVNSLSELDTFCRQHDLYKF